MEKERGVIMVSENFAYQLQNFEEAEIDESPVKWCSVTLSDIIARGKRLEASVYDVEAKQATESSWCRETADHHFAVRSNGTYTPANRCKDRREWG